MMVTKTIIEQTDRRIFNGATSGVVFTRFPLYQNDYFSDVQEIISETIKRYGHEEWRLITLTCELHGHLGIYAVLGAKMGLFAREVLGACHDEHRIVSMAGSKPPVSCLNDGLQVSTGATIGHGLFSVKEVIQPVPEAKFTYNGKTVTIFLDEEIQEKIEGDIKEILAETGGLTAEYWQKIRELGLEVWRTYDRRKIFMIKP